MIFRKIIFAGFLANIGFGPASVYLMRLNLKQGFGYTWKLISAILVSDITYALLALFASTWITPWIQTWKHYLLLGLAGFLFFLSWKFWKKDTHHTISLKKQKKGDIRKDMINLTIIIFLNPTIVLMYTALFTTLEIRSENISGYFISMLILCVSIGALLRYIPLLRLTAHSKRKKSQKILHLFTQGLTILIFLLGIYLCLDVFWFHYL